MATQRSSFEKLARDRAKKEKAAAKREKRQERAAGSALTPDADAATDAALTDEGGTPCSPAELLRMIESIHQRFEAGTMSYEDFEDARVNLLGRLPVD